MPMGTSGAAAAAALPGCGAAVCELHAASASASTNASASARSRTGRSTRPGARRIGALIAGRYHGTPLLRSPRRDMLGSVMDDVAIEEAWNAGRAAWPALALDRERFAAYLVRHDAPAPAKHSSDLYLAAACLAGDRAALAVFDRELLIAARSAIRS